MSGSLPLLVTRPEPGNSATIARAAALGLDAYAMPLFAARALPWTAPAPQDFDAILLTSAQAVRLAGPQLMRLALLPVYAVVPRPPMRLRRRDLRWCRRARPTHKVFLMA